YGRLAPLSRPISRLIGGAGPNPGAVSDLLMSRGDAITSMLDRLNGAPEAIRPQLPLVAGAGVAPGRRLAFWGPSDAARHLLRRGDPYPADRESTRLTVGAAAVLFNVPCAAVARLAAQRATTPPLGRGRMA